MKLGRQEKVASVWLGWFVGLSTDPRQNNVNSKKIKLFDDPHQKIVNWSTHCQRVLHKKN